MRIWAILVLCSAAAVHAEETEVRTATVTVVTASADETGRTVLARAEALGGRLQKQTGEALSVLIPGLSPEQALAQTLPEGTPILARHTTREDAGERMADLRSRIESKRKHLANLKRLFDETDFAQTLEIEKEYLKAVQEMERLIGELRVLEESARYTVLEIRFRLESRPAASTPPQFPWMAERGADQVLGDIPE